MPFPGRNARATKGLARIFHTYGDYFQRNIRFPFGKSDFVAASPDKVGPTGRRCLYCWYEIFGLEGNQTPAPTA
jgi:hypothetical protein